jgi:Nif-specific regulatory protein
VDDLSRLPAQRLQSLLEMSQLLTSTLELEEVLDLLLTRAGEMVDCEGASLLLLDPTGSTLQFVVAKGSKGKALVEQRLPVGTGIAGWVARHGKPLVVQDVRKDPRFYEGLDKELGFATRSLLAAPLIVRDRVIGVIEAVNVARPQGFVDEDISLFSLFANYAAIAIENGRLYAAVYREREQLRNEVGRRYEIVGKSPVLVKTLDMARAVADSNATVLLLGESGTGKELFARAIHHWSPRATRPFVAVSCTVLSQELLASELFGHEKGAFTGAVRQKPGKVEQAEGGTLFLDEIGEMRPELQIKLLRVLQEHEFERVGGTRTIQANIRVIAATNRDLEAEVRRGGFREDLYYRLNVVAITVPPLRDRREDVDSLVAFFLEKHAKESRKNLKPIAPEALQALRAYEWPGNVRELENVIQRGLILSRGERLETADLPSEIHAQPDEGPPRLNAELKRAKRIARDHAAAEVERQFLERILLQSKGNVTRAAIAVGMNRTLLQQLLKKYAIDRSRFRG